jgi:plastin-1
LINDAVPGTIDPRVLNTKNLNKFTIVENNNVVIQSCKGIGLSVVNIGPVDIFDGTPHLLLGLLWQIIKIALSATVNIKVHIF